MDNLMLQYELFYCEMMNDSQFQRNKPQLFHQKGWIANQFKVKHNVSAILKTRQKSITETNRPEHLHGTTPIHFKSVELYHSVKPSTAPEKTRRKMDFAPAQTLNGMSGISDDQLLMHLDSKYSNFKTTLNNRKPLLFIKPYTRNSTSLTIDQKKTQIYRQINNPDLTHFNLNFKKTGPIQYLTEYAQPFTTRMQKPKYRPKMSHRQRNSLHVLKQKLKRHCEMSNYQAKINTVRNL